MRPRSCRRRLAPPLLALALVAGCKEPRNVGRPASAPPAVASEPATAPDPATPVEPAPAPATAPEAPKPASHGEILGKRTQDIRPAEPEREKGARVADTRITARDPITLPGNAYVTIVGRSSILNIQHTMDLYKATNDRYPANFQEFMAEIIKPNGIALPVLPSYQEYGYDEKEHKLIILEYPDRRAIAHPGER